MSQTKTKRSFSTTFKTEEIEIDGKNYVMRELNGTGRDKYIADSQGRITLDADRKVVGLPNMDGAEAFLISLVLSGPDGKPVAPDVIKDWPASVVTQLSTLAKEMSGLEAAAKKEMDAAKKD